MDCNVKEEDKKQLNNVKQDFLFKELSSLKVKVALLEKRNKNEDLYATWATFASILVAGVFLFKFYL